MPTTKNQDRPQVIKQPMRVEVKLLVPYALLTILAITIAAFIGGWFAHNNYQYQVKAEAHQLVSSLKASE